MYTCLKTSFLNSPEVLIFLLIIALNLSFKKQISDWDTILTCSGCFLGSPQSYFFDAKSVDAGRVCIKRACDEGTCIGNISACASDAYIRSTCGKGTCIGGAYIKAFCIDSACISSFGAVKYLRIYLQLFQISEIRLFKTTLETRLGANWYKICF